MSKSNLFVEHMGDEFKKLDPMVQQAHRGKSIIQGIVGVSQGNFLARMICRLLKLPKAGTKVELRVEADHQADIVYWNRNFAGQQMNTRFRRQGDYVYESLGPVKLFFYLENKNGALIYNLKRVALWGMRLPLFIAPKLSAFEKACAGKYSFKVLISLPVIGKLIEYHGELLLETES